MDALTKLLSEVKRHLSIDYPIRLADIVLKFSDTSITIIDTSDATATAADIAKGKVAFNAEGKVTGIATFAQAKKNTFYKCAAVDQQNHTWSGYKVLEGYDSSTYEDYIKFDTTLTEGLIYIQNKPEVDKCYSPNALFQILLNRQDFTW